MRIINKTFKNGIYNTLISAVFVAFMVVCAWITLPFGLVPITLQTFAVFTAAGLLGLKRATVSVLVYIILGAVGLPVFNGFSGGIGVIIGPTGGYIIGLVFISLIVGLVKDIVGNNLKSMLLSMVIGLIVCYAIGTVWFVNIYSTLTGEFGIGSVLMTCVVPFILPDLIKIFVSLIIVRRISTFLKI